MDNKPFKYPEGATPEQVGKLAERLERGRQMSGQKPDLTKQEIRRKQHYNKLWNINKGVKYVGSRQHLYDKKPTKTNLPKVDVDSISKGINNYMELTKKDEETKRPENFDKKFRDPDMDKGLGALVPIDKNLKK